jgi:hypothetical protein
LRRCGPVAIVEAEMGRRPRVPVTPGIMRITVAFEQHGEREGNT